MAQTIVHEFFVPIPESQARTALTTIEPASGIVGQTMESVISIVITGNGTSICYDHWEDGYEVDLAKPKDASTQIWGDGNNSNGIPPGFANDPAGLPSGAVISLRNQVPLPRNPASILYDGRDRFGGTKALVSTRTAWATTPGTVLAGSVELPATMDYGTQFISPVGEDVNAASMFEYAGLFVMARDNGTSVTVDKDGPGSGSPISVVLNRGESYQVNAGVKKGATVNSNKPVQAQLITGDIGARYETDWFTLFPVDQWSSTYYSPVGTAADGDATFGFFYNPNGAPITINVLTCLGPSNFNVAANGVYQYQFPQSCGAKFSTAGGQPFFGIAMVGANPAANNVHDWGFTLVPGDALTTEAVVGWGPGSSDLSQNGSPVWVTPVAATRVYVDYNGDRNGALTDPNGNKYDTHYDIGALETRTLYDPDKDQTAMRLYTLDGTLITAAWGQDPAVAGPGNPFLDVGTTVLPFPVPVLKKSSTLYTDIAPAGLSVNDVLEYNVTIENRGLLPLGNLVVLDSLPASLSYVANSTTRDGNPIADGSTGTPFPLDESGYTVPIILRGGTTTFKYRVTILQSGTIENTASNVSYNLTAENTVEVPPGGGSTPCVIAFTDAAGASMAAYAAGASVYATLTDPDSNNSPSVAEFITVPVTNTTNGDAEFITLMETGVNTGVFRNTTGLATSLSGGLAQQDGVLHVTAGDSLSVTHTDEEFGETCSDTAVISAPSQTKTLYLSTDGSGSPDQDLDRIDPAAAGDGSTAQTAALSTGSGWQYKKQLTFSNGSRPENLVNFPVLVRLTSSNFDFSKAQSNGQDIRFFDADGTTALSYQIEFWDAAAQSAFVWVKVPQIDASSSTDSIWMHYGNAGASDAQDAAAVWNGHRAVWHMNENSGTSVTDSTGNSWDGTPTSVTLNATGNVDGSDTYTGTSYTTLPSGYIVPNGSSAWTFESWIYLESSVSNYDRIFTQYNSGGTSLNLYYHSGKIEVIPNTAGASAGNPVTAASVSTGQWVHFTWIHNSATDTLYVNGSSSSTTTSGSNVGFIGNYIGARSTTQNFLHGRLDEMRVSSVARSANWVSAQYSTMNNTFVTYSSEQSASSPAFVSSKSTAANNNTVTLTAVDCGSASDRLLLVGVTMTGTGRTVSGITYGGTPLTLVSAKYHTDTNEARSELWRLVNPAAGSANVVVSITGAGANNTVVGAAAFSGVHQTTPLGTAATGEGLSLAATINVTSAADDLVFAMASHEGAGSYTQGSGQVERWDQGLSTVTGTGSTKAGAAGSVTMTSTFNSNEKWTMIGVPIKPAAVGGGSSTTSFTQIPVFAANFVMPAGSAPSAQNYFTVTSGSMPASPSITAVLKYDSTTIATSSSASSDGSKLTFNFPALGGNVTVPAGQAITLEITTAQSGVSFTIDYDSQTKPSKISLPTTTVIDVNSLAVYDAPYPGGSVVTSPANGATLYVRSTVSDPFGAYDITSLGLNIDGPGTGGDISTTLGAGNVVSTTAGTKTYEYVWQTGTISGAYNIAVTANEGTEGITDVAATSVTLTFLDLGTPSTTEFTTGLNGPGTPTYAGNEQVFVRVTDLDQNINAAVIETVTATITTSSGDSETVTLTETGVNTGIFAAGIPASTSGGGGTNNGTLNAPLGTVLDVSYTDPTDATDTSSDTATVPAAVGTPDVTVSKVLVSPADGQAAVGENVQFQIQITNSGSTTLNTVSLVDNFPDAKLGFASASPAANSVGLGSLTWNNVGPLTPGQNATVIVNFTAMASAAPATNSATADAGGGVIDTATADVTITNPAHTITKTLLSPNPGPANIGDNVVFRIVVQNTGDTAIATLPLEDTFSGASFDFVSATLTPTSTGSGSLFWSDITGGGNLAPGNSITIDVTLQATGAANPASNTADADYSVDVNGDPVPSATNTSTIVLLAATITGTVYNDADESGGFTAGDTGLSPVTIELYTDPNGDGNPADGTLVAVTTTDSSGVYEFLNLALGDYVVVETDPSGYTSSGDTSAPNDNRIPLDVPSLTTFAGNNFFDYLPDPADYATINGKVWEDADASGAVNGGETGIENVTVDLVQDINNNGLADPGEPVTASTATAADGAYSFTMIPPGEYVIRETDRFGYTSTADTDAPNDNQIEITAIAGATSSGNDFLDVLTGTVSGFVYYDTEGNGAYDVGMDAPLANVDVLVTNSLSGTQTVSTDANGNWTATVPPGSTTADIDNTDPDFITAFINSPLQTEGADPTTVAAISSSNVSAGNDGFVDPSIITGTVMTDTDNDDVGDAPIPGVVLTLLDDLGGIIDGDPGTPGVQPVTATTNGSGVFTFNGLVPGTYQISEAQPAGYQSIGDRDGGDLDIIGDIVPRTVDPGETDSGNDFIEEQFGSITGSVLADIDNDDTGDSGIAGVVLTLLDSSGAPIDGDAGTPGVQPVTTTTNGSGVFTFSGVEPGDYRIGEAQPAGYQSINDADGGNLDQIGDVTLVSVAAGAASSGNEFVEEQLGTISGTVFADTNNDDLGDAPLLGVTIALFTDPNGDGDPTDGAQLGGSITTDAGGGYAFGNLEPASYVVVQTQPVGYLTVSDGDTTATADDAANTSTTDNRIPVAITAGETDDGNGFVEEQVCAVSGAVLADTNNDDAGDSPMPNVTVALFTDPNGDGDPSDGAQLGASQLTLFDGSYFFSLVPPGSYVMVQLQPAGYLTVSDADDVADIAGSPADAPNASATDNRIPLNIQAGEWEQGNNFIEEQPASIGNLVWIDGDNDGLKDAGENGLGGVVVELLNGSGNSIDSDAGTPGVQPTTVTTNGSGAYSFGNLPAGSYQLRIASPPATHPLSSSNTDTNDNGEDDDDNGSQPGGSGAAVTSPVFVLAAGEADGTMDFSLYHTASVGNLVFRDTNGNGRYDAGEGVDGVSVVLKDSGGNDIDSDPGTPGVQPTQTNTSSGGFYVISGIQPGGYTLHIPALEFQAGGQLAGIPSLPGQGGDDGLDDDVDENGADPAKPWITGVSSNVFVLSDGGEPAASETGGGGGSDDGGSDDQSDLTMDFGFVSGCPTSFEAWQQQNPLGGNNGAGGNPDNDRFDNLQEYAFCYTPDSGVVPGCPVVVVVNNSTGRIDALARRVPGVTDITYTLEFITDLSNSGANGAGWSDVTTIIPTVTGNGDGTETATYADLASIPALATGKGFVRARIELDADGDTFPEATSRTLAAGWSTRSLSVQCQTCSDPFLRCDIFGGAVDAVGASALDVTSSAGTQSVAGAFVAGQQYYLEVIAGDNEGHRFDIDEAASTAASIAIEMTSSRNTLASLPPNLAGDTIAVREHRTLDGMLDKSLFTATSNQSTADRLLFYERATSQFVIYWLFSNSGSPKWVLSGDATLADQGGRIVDVSEGMFIHTRTNAVNLVLSGKVRENDVACPLQAGHQLVGGGWALQQSPAGRAMSTATGFTGGRDPRLVDQIRFWEGDTAPGTEAYVSHFLLDTATLHHWTRQTDASLINEDALPLFQELRAGFVKSISGNSTWVVPMPWTP